MAENMGRTVMALPIRAIESSTICVPILANQPASPKHKLSGALTKCTGLFDDVNIVIWVGHRLSEWRKQKTRGKLRKQDCVMRRSFLQRQACLLLTVSEHSVSLENGHDGSPQYKCIVLLLSSQFFSPSSPPLSRTVIQLSSLKS